MSGFVSFVSAGPGDPGLLTLRAAERLRDADIVLYDALCAGPILDLAGPRACCIPVGKRAGRPSTSQTHLNALMVDYARAGCHVVRLKAGDAGLFGRLEEEQDALAEAGIAWDIVAGVSSASAAVAAAGMPLTRRRKARRVQYVTGADVTGGLPEDLNWAALADPSALSVVFMGQRSFPRLVQGLIAHGLPADTPAMLAKAVGHPEQEILRDSVAGLAARLTREGPSTHPALIFYGALAEAPALLPQAARDGSSSDAAIMASQAVSPQHLTA